MRLWGSKGLWSVPCGEFERVLKSRTCRATLTLADEACVGGEGMPGADGNGARGAVATERGRKAGEGRGWREE